jgi:hypothetical protein
MFTLCSEDTNQLPFMCNIDKIASYQHMIFENTEELYRLKLRNTTSQIENEKDVAKILGQKFNRTTKLLFFKVIDRFGTHYVKEVTFGSKAELRWSIEGSRKNKDAFGNVVKEQKNKKKFEEAARQWERNGFKFVLPLDAFMLIV